jgi:hypothetical protein
MHWSVTRRGPFGLRRRVAQTVHVPVSTVSTVSSAGFSSGTDATYSGWIGMYRSMSRCESVPHEDRIEIDLRFLQIDHGARAAGIGISQGTGTFG